MTKKNIAPKKDESAIPIKQIFISSLISSAMFFILLIILALVVFKTSANQSLYLLYGLAAGGLSSFFGGFISLRLIKEKGLFFGGICGFIQSLICSLIIFILNKGTAGNGIFILIALMTFVSSLGGLTAVNIKKKIKY